MAITKKRLREIIQEEMALFSENQNLDNIDLKERITILKMAEILEQHHLLESLDETSLDVIREVKQYK